MVGALASSVSVASSALLGAAEAAAEHGEHAAAVLNGPNSTLKLGWLVVALPFVGWLLTLFFGKRSPMRGAIYGVTALGAGLLISIAMFFQVAGGAAPYHQKFYTFDIGGYEVSTGFSFDSFTVMMFAVVTLISFLVHIYSLAYMKDEVRFTFFYATLSLFTGSMLLMVASDNLLQMFVGWELVGVCSYLLIGHYWEEKPNSSAAIKAFITTRIGDVGMMFGIFVLFFAAGTFDIGGINGLAASGGIKHGILLAGATLLFIGVIGKSAQFPLHVWLPDAMAGPTPVSALIHAATMVVAGIYLVARNFDVFRTAFALGPGGPANVVMIIGTITMLIAALLAMVQDDIKKVLAYSTVSQLGYMVAALGVGAWTAAVFHLFTHAMFKALLFLGSGSVIHAVHSNNMSDMGGLRKEMPVTFWTFLIGSAALAGVPGLAGFFSKDEILHFAFHNHYYAVFGVGLLTAALTALYMTRCVSLTFFGEFRGHGHPHESPRLMTVPLVVLAVLSVTVGSLNFWGMKGFGVWIAYAGEQHVAEFDVVAMLAGTAAGAIGILLGLWIYYWKKAPQGLLDRVAPFRWAHTLLMNKYYLDDLYIKGIVRPVQYSLSKVAYWINQKIIDGVVNGVGVMTRKALAEATYWLDQTVVDGFVNDVANEAGEAGGALRRIQTGKAQQYVAVAVVATAVLVIAVVWAVR
ncbi:MAG: NADH-quinone oxidoreductase subunit L [Acidobacteria bacterium]|nr:MAG: NADH-quinone oxidoreductase subunit L [Acidobacteriota bacterium]